MSSQENKEEINPEFLFEAQMISCKLPYAGDIMQRAAPLKSPQYWERWKKIRE